MLRVIVNLLVTLSVITACVAQPAPIDSKIAPDLLTSPETEGTPAVKQKSDEELITWRLNHTMHNYSNKQVMQKIAQETHKFHALADSCRWQRGGLGFLEGSFDEPFAVAEGVYVVPFYCASYAAGRVFQLFPFTASQGLSTTPLTLSQFNLKTANQYVQEDGVTFFGLPSYQSSTQEFEIRGICHQSAGSPRSLTRYRYENDRFVLKEFWSNSKEKCKQGEPLSQIYPPPK
jgi:hypothetical protein